MRKVTFNVIGVSDEEQASGLATYLAEIDGVFSVCMDFESSEIVLVVAPGVELEQIFSYLIKFGVRFGGRLSSVEFKLETGVVPDAVHSSPSRQRPDREGIQC